MVAMPDPTHLLAFVLGVAISALGGFVAWWLVNRHSKQEARAETHQTFDKVCNAMPELIVEMNADVDHPDAATVREFLVFPARRVGPGLGTAKKFRYYEDEHDDLRGKMNILLNHNFIVDTTEASIPKYRMTEEFVELLRAER